MAFYKLAHKIADFWNGQTLQKKLSFCLICMTISPLLLTMAITEVKNEKTLTRLVIGNNRSIAERTAEDIDQMFSGKVKVLRVAANTAEMKSMLPDRQRALLQVLAETDGDIQIALVADSAGNQIARSDGLCPMIKFRIAIEIIIKK